jgi:hypothetical protein
MEAGGEEDEEEEEKTKFSQLNQNYLQINHFTQRSQNT